MHLYKNILNFYNDKIFICRLIMIDFFVRVLSVFSTDNNFFGDATARLETAMYQAINFSLMPHMDWQPVPFWIQGLFIKLTGDLIYAPRVVGVLAMSMSLYFFYETFKKITSLSIAKISIILVSLSLSVFFVSNITLSEPYFFLFSSIIIWATFNDSKRTSLKYYLLLGVCCICLALTRLEGWGILFFLFVMCLIKKQKKLGLTIFTGTALGVVYWEAVSISLGGGFLRALLFSNLEVKNLYAHHKFTLSEAFYRTFIGMPFLSFLGPACAAFTLLFKKFQIKVNIKQYIFFVLAIFSIIFYKVVAKSLFPEFRYSILYGILFIPIVLNFLSYIMNSKRYLLLIPIFMFCDFYLISQRFIISDHLWHKDGFKDSIRFFNANYKEGHHIYVDFDGHWERESWVTYTRSTLRGVKVCRVESHFWLGQEFTKESFEKCIQNLPIYLVAFPDGKLNSFLNENMDELKKQYHFELIYLNNYKIWIMNSLKK